MEGHPGYRFGDITRMTYRWLGPHARAIRGQLDWLKFGKALVVAMIAGQTVNWTVVGATAIDAIRDPRLAAQLAAVLPTILSIIAFIIEAIRRLLQDGKDAPITSVPEQYADGSQAALPVRQEEGGDPGQIGIPGQIDLGPDRQQEEQ